MLNDEDKLNINVLLERRVEIRSNIQTNLEEIAATEKKMYPGMDPEMRYQAKEHIKRGQGINSILKTELSAMSSTKIVAITGIAYHNVKYQEMLFNRARIVL